MFWIITGGLALYSGLQVLRTKHQLERAQLEQRKHAPRHIGLLEAAIAASFDTGDRIADTVNRGYEVYARIKDRHDEHREKQQYLAWLDTQKKLTAGEDDEGEGESDSEDESDGEGMESDGEGADAHVGSGEGEKQARHGDGDDDAELERRTAARVATRGGSMREPATGARPPAHRREDSATSAGEAMRRSMRAEAAPAANSGPRSMDEMLRHVPAYPAQ